MTPLKKQLETSANLSYMKFTAADSAKFISKTPHPYIQHEEVYTKHRPYYGDRLRARAGIYLHSGTKSAAHVRAKMSAPIENALRARSLTTADRCGRVVRGRSSKS